MRIANIHSASAAAAGAIFGISHQAVGKWRQSGAPRNKDGSYDLTALVEWKIEREVQLAGVPFTESNDNDQRYKAARATLAEIDVAHRQGEFLRASEVEQRVVGAFTTFSALLQNLPSVAAARLEGKAAREIETYLESALRDAVEEMKHVYESGEVE